MQLRCRAIVLRTTRFRDADLVVHFLTEKGQGLVAIARSALRSKKRFGGGVLEPTRHVEIVAQKKSAEDDDSMASLAEAQVIDGFEGLRSDYNRLQMALELMGIIDKMIKPGDVEQPQLFNLVGHALKKFETFPNPEIVKVHALTRLLDQQGVLPHEAQFEPFLKIPISRIEDLQVDQLSLASAKQSLAVFSKQYFGSAKS